jgi:hypothetical protein
MMWLYAAFAVFLAACAWVVHRAVRRNVTRWLPAYLRRDWAGARERGRADGGLRHLMFCLADHFEPAVGRAAIGEQRRRVDRWMEDYPPIADQFRDADGYRPRHTFFFPAEEYVPEHLERLSELVSAGYGEVEVHLHHDGDTSEGLRGKLEEFKRRLREHGHLGSRKPGGAVSFAFVHGNWALDNSLPDGTWCGVNDELRVLRQCGCYADLTLPSAPSPAQTRRINSIYYATDDPQAPRSHDDGEEVRVGGAPVGDLMIIQGPLTVSWPGGRYGILPAIETANLAGGTPVTARRVRSWVRTPVCVAGRPEWVFVKAYTHGCDERNWPLLFGEPIRRMHRLLGEAFNDGANWKLHYVTAREMYNIIKAAEQGLRGDPCEYRDLEVAAPPAAVSAGEEHRQRQEVTP